MVGLLCSLNMGAQTLLLLVQRLLLFPPDAFAAHDHHDRLIARLFAVRRAARRFLPPLALLRTELFSALAPARYRCHALLVVRLCLLARAENVALRDERRRVVCSAGRGGLFGGFERGQLALCGGTAPIFNGFAGCFYSQVIEHCEVGGCENLGARGCIRSTFR
jgi:hypothetical protein